MKINDLNIKEKNMCVTRKMQEEVVYRLTLLIAEKLEAPNKKIIFEKI